jgi:hypothetical protein
LKPNCPGMIIGRSSTKFLFFYADSAYANKKNDEKLGKQNNKVLHRAYSFDIIVGFRILSVIAIPTLAFA